MGLKPQDSIFQSIGEDLTSSSEILAVQPTTAHEADREYHHSLHDFWELFGSFIAIFQRRIVPFGSESRCNEFNQMWHEQFSGKFIFIEIIWTLFYQLWMSSKVGRSNNMRLIQFGAKKETNAHQKRFAILTVFTIKFKHCFIIQSTRMSFDSSLRTSASPHPSLSGKWFWFVPKTNFPAPNKRKPFSRFFSRGAIPQWGTIFCLLIIKIYLVYFIWTHSTHIHPSSYAALKSAHKK